MESVWLGQSVQIEMERSNKEPCAEPVPPESSRGLKRGVILGSVMGLVVVISVCLLFHFVFVLRCVQMDIPPAANTTGKVNITCRHLETEQKGHYEIFKVEKDGKFLIHGWLRCSDVSGDVQLVHWDGEHRRTLQKNSVSELSMFFGTEVQLFKGNRVSLQFTSQSFQYQDSCFYVYEL